MKFKEKLSDLMRQSGKRITDIADDLNINKGTVSRWKSGADNPSKENRERLAEYFGQAPDYFDNNVEVIPMSEREINEKVMEIVNRFALADSKVQEKTLRLILEIIKKDPLKAAA